MNPFTYLPIYTSVHSSIHHPSICSLTHSSILLPPTIHLPIHSLIHPSIFPSTHILPHSFTHPLIYQPFLCPSVRPSIHLLIYLLNHSSSHHPPIHPSIHLPHPFIHPFNLYSISILSRVPTPFSSETRAYVSRVLILASVEVYPVPTPQFSTPAPTGPNKTNCPSPCLLRWVGSRLPERLLLLSQVSHLPSPRGYVSHGREASELGKDSFPSLPLCKGHRPPETGTVLWAPEAAMVPLVQDRGREEGLSRTFPAV
uniref:Uncharacterized protein n=1 Tax=Pipistrellus kuhlii TaxID=59472 RepID=A0A7J7S4D4_PIPKU|nr:hypothetical protein mPipKuh1_010187 [Pipistrellus kuhlii]